MIKEILFGTPICFNPGGKGVQYWANCFNGTFSDGRPISIMINNGQVIQDNSCHHIWEYPETVFYIKKDGSMSSDRVQTYTQIEGYKDIVFAIGGVGLSDYNPEAEGFCEFERKNIYNGKIESKTFVDVLDETDHSVFGVVDGKAFAAIMHGTGQEIADECKKHNMTHCVMGDGRSWAAANTDDLKLNTNKAQYSLVQMTKLIKYELPQLEEPEEKQWNYFKYSEFANSEDGGVNKTSYDLIDLLDKVRPITGSITVTSGYRTPEYNKKIGGSSNSNHLLGHAADIKFDFSGWTVTSIKKLFSGFGFKNIGIYMTGNTFRWIHVDIGNEDFRRWNVGNGWHHYRGSAYKVYEV